VFKIKQNSTSKSAIKTQTLDFLRGVAAMYVVINHLRGVFFKGGSRTLAEATDLGFYDYISLAILQITSLGTEFVILFFFISGFTMAHSISQNTSVAKFFHRRLIRMWPPYLLAIFLSFGCCLLFAVFLPENQITGRCEGLLCTAHGLIKISLYYEVVTPITSQFWSLPYEVIFYLVCPLILANKYRIKAVLTLGIFFSICGLIWYGFGLLPSDIILINFLISALLFFMVGAYFYDRVYLIPIIRPIPFVFLLLTLFMLTYVTKVVIGGPNLITSCIMTLIAAVSIRNIPSSITSNKWLNLGFFSYSLYIFHMGIIYLCVFFLDIFWNLQANDISHYWAWLLPLPIVILGSWLLYFISERKCNLLLIKLRTK
jgi:peptidoglycan/LPS O-acetylase OafA/YrhL